MTPGSELPGERPFTERSFYRSEFRDRTLALAACPGSTLAGEAVREVLDELSRNATRVVLLSTRREELAALSGGDPPELLDAGETGLEGRVWRALQRGGLAAIQVAPEACFSAVHDVALRLGVMKLVWLDPRGGLVREDGSRRSFVDLEDLALLSPDSGHAELLREVERALRAGLHAVNLCTAEGLGEELFTYAGSGTLFTERGYVEVRRLTIDDFGAALALVARGVEEGFLAPRSPEEQDAVLGESFGAFVEGRHLAGIGALLRHGDVGEIASLYTLTRFLGEGIGGHLVRALAEASVRRGDRYLFACTTTSQVVGFFERMGFRRVDADTLPKDKWATYDPERRARLVCLKQAP